jgi:hypothetical protein
VGNLNHRKERHAAAVEGEKECTYVLLVAFGGANGITKIMERMEEK